MIIKKLHNKHKILEICLRVIVCKDLKYNFWTEVIVCKDLKYNFRIEIILVKWYVNILLLKWKFHINKKISYSTPSS